MALSEAQRYILFALGRWYDEANKRLAGKPVEVAISKAVFIDTVHKAALAEKKERALYRNLESLEKRKYISYANRNLALTKRGNRLYEKINRKMAPYVTVVTTLKETNPFSYSKKAQTKFVNG
ncbi:hypothetical protein HY642_07090 [Candidatus Woesearchaeota archaeon]|nr:hypothetical protein [Candidatus Woesearchaeota archaeon]